MSLSKPTTLLDNYSSGFVWTTDLLIKDVLSVFSLSASTSTKEADDEITSYLRRTIGPARGWSGDSRVLLDGIYDMAIALPHYKQSGLRLSKQCESMVKHFSKEPAYRLRQVHLELEEPHESIITRLVLAAAEELVDRDLTRVLEFLAILQQKDQLFFQDATRVHALFSYVQEYLLLKRPFLKYTDEELRHSRDMMGYLNDFEKRRFDCAVRQNLPLDATPHSEGLVVMEHPETSSQSPDTGRQSGGILGD